MLSMRKNKRGLMSLMASTIFVRNYWTRPITDGIVIDFSDIGRGPDPFLNKLADEMLEAKIAENAAVAQAMVEFICLRVKDDVVVDTFDTVEAAQALVEKHAKGRKAKLYVKNSLTGEQVLFSGEETV